MHDEEIQNGEEIQGEEQHVEETTRTRADELREQIESHMQNAARQETEVDSGNQTPLTDDEGKKGEEGKGEHAADDEDDPPPKGSAEYNRWAARTRKKAADYRRQLEEIRKEHNELKERINRNEQEREQGKRVSEETEGSKKKYDLASVVLNNARAREGRFQGDKNQGVTADAQNATVLKLSTRYIDEYGTTGELREILRKAENGDFGEESEDVGIAVKEMLPRVLSRELEGRQASEQDVEKRRRAMEADKKRWIDQHTEALKEFKAFEDEKSEERKALPDWEKEHFGEIDPNTRKLAKPGSLPAEVALAVMRNPKAKYYLVTQYLKAKKLESVSAELAQLKKRFGVTRQPERGGLPGSGTEGKPKSRLDQLRSEIEKRAREAGATT